MFVLNLLRLTILKTTDIETTQIVPRLRLNVDDNEFFTKCILASPDDSDRKITPTKESHKRIQDAAELAVKYIRGHSSAL